MTSRVALPLVLEHPRHVPGGGTRPRDGDFAPVAYAYVLVDLSGTGTANEEGFLRTRRALSERVADDVTWRMVLCTNGRGELVDPWAGSGPVDVDADVDLASARWREAVDDPERTPPVLFPAGLDLNLWWCRLREDLDAARRAGGPVEGEHCLKRVSTWLDGGDAAQLTVAARLYLRAYPGDEPLAERDPGALVRRMGENLLRDRAAQERAGRPPATVTSRGLVVRTEDRVLDECLSLAGRILRLMALPGQHGLAEDLAVLERADGIFRRRIEGRRDAADPDAPVGSPRFNFVIRRLGADRAAYRHTIGNLRRVPQEIWAEARVLGRALLRGHRLAVHEARWHYWDTPPRRGGRDARPGQDAVALLMNVVGQAELDRLRDRVFLPGALPAWATAALDDEDPGDAGDARDLAHYLRSLGKVLKWTNRTRTLVERATTWIEALCLAAAEVAESDVARYLDRVAHVTYRFHYGQWPSPRVWAQVESVTLSLPVEAMAAGVPWRVSARAFRAATEELGRFGKALKVLNCVLVIANLPESPSFAQYIEAGHSAAEVAALNDSIKLRVCEAFGISSAELTRALGAIGVAVYVMKASEALAQGNTVGCLGNLMMGAGSFLGLVSRGGVAGVAAAVVVIAGAVVVAYSLDDDEAWLLEYFSSPGVSGDSTRTRGHDAAGNLNTFDRAVRALGGTRGATTTFDRVGLPA